MSRKAMAFIGIVVLMGALQIGCAASGAGRKPVATPQGLATMWHTLDEQDAWYQQHVRQSASCSPVVK